MSVKTNNVTGFWGKLGKFFAYFVMFLFAFMAIAPLVWLIINSFKSTIEFQTDMVGLPNKWIKTNYQGAWEIGHFSILFVNSVIYTCFFSWDSYNSILNDWFWICKNQIKSHKTNLFYIASWNTFVHANFNGSNFYSSFPN